MRLFWKILGGYFLAWALLSLALFGALALDWHSQILPRTLVSQALPSAVGVQIAATHVSQSGADEFHRMATNWTRGEPPYVVDEQGREVLGRAVDPATLELARSLAVDSFEPVPVKNIRAPDGRHYVVFYPEGTGPEDQSLFGGLIERPWLLGVIFAAAGLLLASGLAALWTRPIAALEASFDSMADGHEAQIDPSVTRRKDEIGDLGRHFEAMAKRLSRSVAGQKQLLHDVSHELRSPLARLAVAAELARRQPDRIEEALERIDRESDRLDRLIAGVLTLARLESATAEPLDDYFDLLELLRVIRDDVAFEAAAVGVDVELRIPDREELVMRGNAELMHRAVENVVRNALQHAGESRQIEMILEGSGSEIVLRVRDQGQGIDAEQLAKLFEPFAHGSSSAGFGLGLAIARRAVAVHGGSIEARNDPAGGVEVQIRLPLDVGE